MSTTVIRSIPQHGVQPGNGHPAGNANSNSANYLARSVALHLGGKREEALDELRRAIAAGQSSPEIYRAMGHIQFELADYAASAQSYRSLTRIKPQYTQGWFNLAVSLERQGDWETAAEAFHQVATLDAHHLDAQLGLAVCYLRLEDPRSALHIFDACLELEAAHPDALFGKAAALQSLGHSDEAAVLYQQILASNPESEESLSNLVLIGLG